MGYKKSRSNKMYNEKKDSLACHHTLAHQGASVIPPRLQIAGDVSNKFRVYFPEYRMSVFIDDPEQEDEIRLRFSLRNKVL